MFPGGRGWGKDSWMGGTGMLQFELNPLKDTNLFNQHVRILNELLAY